MQVVVAYDQLNAYDSDRYVSDCYLAYITGRVRTILILGYWVLGDIRRYWIVLLLGIFLFIVTPNMIPIRQQSAPST